MRVSAQVWSKRAWRLSAPPCWGGEADYSAPGPVLPLIPTHWTLSSPPPPPPPPSSLFLFLFVSLALTLCLSLSSAHTRTHTSSTYCVHTLGLDRSGQLQLAFGGCRFSLLVARISSYVARSFFAQSAHTPLRCEGSNWGWRWTLGEWGITATVATLPFIDPDKHVQPSVLENRAPETGAGVCVLGGRARISWGGSEGWRRFLRR